MVRVDALRLGLFAFSFAAGPARADAVGYAADVKPLLDVHCAECHHDGGHAPNLGSFPFPSVPADQQEVVVKKILEMVGTSPVKMPPGVRAKLSREQVALIQAWLDQGLKP